MKKQMIIPLVTIILIFAAQIVCQAEDLARLKAQNIRFDKDADVVTAVGEVVITYKDLSITAERVHIAVKERHMVAEGNVEVKQGDAIFYGDELTYDFKSEQGLLQPMRLEIRGEGIEGAIFGGSQQLKIDGDKQTVHCGTLTTCDREKPHYYFSANTLEYLPDEYVIMRHVIYYEGKIPLLYWPYLYISLKDDESNFKTPVFGHDSWQGWYLYLGYDYMTKAWGRGEILLDLMEKLGVGYGIRHTYQWEKDSHIIAELYRLDNPSMNSTHDRMILKYQDRFDDAWSLQAAAKWEEQAYVWANRQRYQTDLFELDTKLSYTGKTLRFNNNMHYWNRNDRDIFYWNPSLQMTLFNTGRLSLNGTWNDSTDYYNANLSYYQRIKGYQLNTSLNRSQDQRDELRLSSPNYKLPWFPAVNWIFQYNRVVPTRIANYPDQEGVRLGLTVEGKSSAIYKKEDDLQLYFAWWLKERHYITTSGDGNLFAVNSSINLEKKILKNLTGKVGLGWTESWDHSPPFPNLMESIYEGGDLTYSLRYNHNKLTASYNGGYNLTHGLWNQQSASVGWRPTSKNSFALSLGFDPERDSGYTSTSWSYRPDDKRFLSLEHRYYKYTYSPVSESLNVNINFDQPLTENFSVHLVSRYDLLNDFINEARLTMSYKWHCRTVMLSYDYYRDTYLLQFKLNAFPDSQLTFNGDSGFLWDDIFKPWNQG